MQLEAQAHVGNPHTKWWDQEEVDEEGPHSAVFASAKHLDDSQDNRERANLHFLRLYSNRAAAGLGGRRFADAINVEDRIRMNVVKSCIDAAVANLATSRPRPMYLPVKGNWEIQKRAKRLGRFVMGQFYGTKLYWKALGIFRDAGIWGSGFIHIYEHGGKIEAVRVFPDEIIVDEFEAQNGDPRTLYRYYEINRETAMAAWPEYADEIKDAGLLKDNEEVDDSEGISDMVTVIDGYHLPEDEDTPGRHVVCFSSCTPVDEEWTRDHFPYVKFDLTENPRGYYGLGWAEELNPLQMEINYIAQKIQKLMNLATSITVTRKGSGMRKIDNKDFGQYETADPQRDIAFHNISSVSGEYFHHLDRLYQRAFEIVGISQLSAQSKKPSGLDSGEALRVYHDIGTKRFQHIGQRWEQWFLDVAEEMLECARDIEARNDGDLKVLTADDNEVEELSFKDCTIEKNKYICRAWPTNIMPDTPAGKVEMITKLGQSSPTMEPYLLRLLTDVPDLDHVTGLLNAPLEIAEMMVSNILEHGKMEAPYPQMNLGLARDVATKAVLRAHLDGVEESRINQLRTYIQQVDELIEAAMPPPQPPMMPAGGPPGQGPMAGPLGPEPMGPPPMGPPQLQGGGSAGKPPMPVPQ